MANNALEAELRRFTEAKQFRGKGPLCVGLVVTQHARSKGLPLDPETLITDGGGQVLGLGKGTVQSILARHGIKRVLASEGGRTSRGSLGKMRDYVEFLNELSAKGRINLNAIEEFWIERVKEFFAGKPFKIILDSSRSLRHVIRHVLRQAIDRQNEMPGTQYAGAVLQHLVGAKLDCALGKGKFEHNGSSVADAPSDRSGDFAIGDVVIHVTTAPTEAVVQKCQDNLNAGYRPIIVTTQKGSIVADGLAENFEIADRIDVFEIEQFLAVNIYEIGEFVRECRRETISSIITRYNEIVDEVETDPSLKIDIKGG